MYSPINEGAGQYDPEAAVSGKRRRSFEPSYEFASATIRQAC